MSTKENEARVSELADILEKTFFELFSLGIGPSGARDAVEVVIKRYVYLVMTGQLPMPDGIKDSVERIAAEKRGGHH